MLVDIGANLTHQSFEHDYAEVLEKAQLDGVKHIIITGTDLVTSEAGASLASKHPTFLSSTVGIHPHNASKANPKQLTQLTLACPSLAIAKRWLPSLPRTMMSSRRSF